MAEEFSFSLTGDEKKYLKELARLSITRRLGAADKGDIPEPPTENLKQHYGAFVTLTMGGHLRGCIGHVVGDKALYKTIYEMARAAAFGDPRFPPLTASELERIEIEISILSPLVPCPDPEKIVIGRHGLVVASQGRSGLLLPQVAVEWKWDREKFLSQTCHKAGLPGDCWRKPDTTLLWFEAEVF